MSSVTSMLCLQTNIFKIKITILIVIVRNLEVFWAVILFLVQDAFFFFFYNRDDQFGINMHFQLPAGCTS
jgi:hypothetical protein